MRMGNCFLGLGLALAIVGGRVQAEPVLQIDANGILTGATGVIVNGASYDVVFKDGSCNSLFAGCDPGTFAFQTATDATSASETLLSQVFLDTGQGHFDSAAYLTTGCGSPILCTMVTPYAWSEYDQMALVAIAENFEFPPSDAVYGRDLGMFPWFDTATEDALAYAVWSPSVTSPVPEPPVPLLILASLWWLLRPLSISEASSIRN
jgi:hypothetical protein